MARRFALPALFLAVLVATGCRGGSSEDVAPSPTIEPGRSSVADTPVPQPTTAPAVQPPSPTPVPGVQPVDYTAESSWLCHPAKPADPCDSPLATTVLSADGTSRTKTVDRPAAPPIDCFYVYPTVSTDPGVNSDLTPGTTELGVALIQAAPFGAQCRVFAPMYRQLTLGALGTGRFNDSQGVATAYGDVVAAWSSYLTNHNDGRGVVLIGHSQGASVLLKLLDEYIDPDPAARALLVSALLMGTSVSVPEGKDVGGAFEHLPACRKPGQVGCIVSYATFSEASPPPVATIFGRAPGLSMQALCVNPSDLAGGSAPLDSWYQMSVLRNAPAGSKAATVAPEGAFVVYEGLLQSRCVKDGGVSYLEVSETVASKEWGIVLPAFINSPPWGLHQVDVSVAMGSLVAVVEAQSAAWVAR